MKVSPGCANCYAERDSTRYGHDVWGKNAPRRTFGEKHWAEPLKWARAAQLAGERRRVFCSSMCDVGEDHATIAAELLKLWPLIRVTAYSLDWLLLTKRAERFTDFLPGEWWRAPYPNVWLGVSIENNDYAWRADYLRTVPAAVRFISYEPALGPLNKLNLTGIDWVIYGGESGPRFRADQDDWSRDMQRRCEAAGVTFFRKQGSALRPGTRADLDGRREYNFPTPRRGVALPVIS